MVARIPSRSQVEARRAVAAPPSPRAAQPHEASVRAKFGDEMSQGKGGALRQAASRLLGARGLDAKAGEAKAAGAALRKEPDAPQGGVVGPVAGARGPGAVPNPASWPLSVRVTATEPLNCRADAAQGAQSQGRFSHGAQLTVLGQRPEAPAAAQWVQVSGPGAALDGQPVELTGWVSAQWVTPPARAVDPRVDERLQALGYVEPNGTTDANDVRNFQVMNGLPETGELDRATLTRLWSASAHVSTHLTQMQSATYNPVKSSHGSGTDGDNSCGPASVAMNLAALGLATIDNADPQGLVVDARTDSGTTMGNTTGPAALKRSAVANGAATTDVANMADVEAALARGEPVVLYGVPNQAGSYAMNSQGAFNGNAFGAIDAGSAHWISVVGTTADGEFIIQDPLSRNGTLSVTREQLEVYAVWSLSDGKPSSFSMSVPPPAAPPPPLPPRGNIPA